MTKKTKLLPPSYLLIGILLMFVLHYLFPLMTLVPKPWIFMGLFSITLGIWINLQADRLFKKARTTIHSFGEPSHLVNSSIYQYSRNPMYLGMVLVLCGVAIVLGSLTPFLIIPIYIVMINNIFIKFEERRMERNFGQLWVEYTLRVRRWI
jgi:protein-S-isoprenylcysteine O-methyltransferase Ste14